MAGPQDQSLTGNYEWDDAVTTVQKDVVKEGYAVTRDPSSGKLLLTWNGTPAAGYGAGFVGLVSSPPESGVQTQAVHTWGIRKAYADDSAKSTLLIGDPVKVTDLTLGSGGVDWADSLGRLELWVGGTDYADALVGYVTVAPDTTTGLMYVRLGGGGGA